MRPVAILLTVTCLLYLLSASTRAQDAPTTNPSTQPAGEAINVKDAEKLKGMIGQDATIRGTVREVFTPQSGSVKIFNFDGIDRRAFNVVIRKDFFEAINAGFGGDVEAAVKGKTITVTGKIAEYRGNPQIQLEKPEQLQIEADAPAEQPEEKPAEKQPE
jgi:DNA/RNA endonuclease YhcR with UshA esterase domain